MDSNLEKLSRSEIVSILSVRDGFYCFICKEPFTEKEEVTIDHWIPLSRGGTWDIENLRLASKRCNALKGDRMPNPDGTLPPIVRERRSVPRAVKRGNRPPVCQTCEAGRKLGPEDICSVCGSFPQPTVFPRWAKMRPSECSHEFPFWCWMEALEPGLRKPAIVDVLDGEYLDE